MEGCFWAFRLLYLVNGKHLIQECGDSFTKRGDRPFLGYLGVRGDSIFYINKDKPLEPFDKIIDCHKNLLMPGFKSAHAHSCMCFDRSYKDDLPLYRWLSEGVWPLEKCLTPSDMYYLEKATILEYIESGITACFDQYFFPEEMARASIEDGI